MVFRLLGRRLKCVIQFGRYVKSDHICKHRQEVQHHHHGDHHNVQHHGHDHRWLIPGQLAWWGQGRISVTLVRPLSHSVEPPLSQCLTRTIRQPLLPHPFSQIEDLVPKSVSLPPKCLWCQTENFLKRFVWLVSGRSLITQLHWVSSVASVWPWHEWNWLGSVFTSPKMDF